MCPLVVVSEVEGRRIEGNLIFVGADSVIVEEVAFGCRTSSEICCRGGIGVVRTLDV